MAFNSPFDGRRSFGKKRKSRLTPRPVERLEPRTLFASINFAAAVTTDITMIGLPAVQTAVTDLNGDGIPDLVALRANNEAQTYLGTSTGNFTPGSIISTGGTVLAFGDFNNDGKVDLATASGILPGNGDGTFGGPVAGFTLPANTVNLYPEQLGADTNLDLVAATFTPAGGTGLGQTNPTIGLVALAGNGNGTFKPGVSTTVASGAGLTAGDAVFQFGDFNGDGDIDVATPFGVLLGNANDTFGNPVAYPFKVAGTGTPVMPAAPLLAIGDFNADGNLDVATIPASGNNGSVEIFQGDGKGNFTDNGSVPVEQGDNITSLVSSDLLNSGTSDLVAGVTTSSGTSDLAVMIDTGNATFNQPTLYPVGGAAVNVTIASDAITGSPDILSVNQVAGDTASYPLDAASVAVLLGTSNAGITPTINFHSSANPAVVNGAFTLTASVPAAVGSATPTGSINFVDGATSLGSVPLTKGKATFSATLTTIGVHSITASYSGDSVYASGTSAALSITVLSSLNKTPLLGVAIGTTTLPTEFLPNDSGNVSLIITNSGNATANGKISASLYLSPDGMVDSSAILLDTPPLANKSIHLSRGGSTTITAHVAPGTITPGAYYLVAQIAPVAVFTADEVSQTSTASAMSYQAAGMVFGTIGKHGGLRLKLDDPNGTLVTFSLSGPGSGAVTETGNSLNISTAGTTSASQLTIASAAANTILGITVNGSLATLQARNTTLVQSLAINGGVNTINLAGVSPGAAGAASITLGSNKSSSLSLGNVGALDLTSAAPLQRVSAANWQSGTIGAPTISSLLVPGTFDANVRTHANGKIANAKIGSITGGTWAVAGNIGTLRLTGNLSNANLFAGADTGPDDLLGTSDDVFASAIIGSFWIGGNITSSTIGAGVSIPVTTTGVYGPFTPIAKGAIHSIVVVGTIDSSTLFVAAKIPATAKIGNVATKTAMNGNFQA